MTFTPVVFSTDGTEQVGIVHHPAEPVSDIGVLIVVGGPQTRVGSHRQYVQLSRYLAEQGFASMRFDYAGMGDSQGQESDFESGVNNLSDAIEAFMHHAGVQRVMLWGLCDAASLILMHAESGWHPAVCGSMLLNPWVRSDQTQAQTALRHYYLKRLVSKAFWKKALAFKLNLAKSRQDLQQNIQQANTAPQQQSDFIKRMLVGLTAANIPIGLVISGNDLTASEFVALCASNKQWKKQTKQKITTQFSLKESDHTFSSAAFKRRVEAATLKFLREQIISG